MTSDVTDPEVMYEHQGQKVFVFKSSTQAQYVLTLVRVLDIGKQELRLTNREIKSGKPDWPVSQRLWEAIQKAEANPYGCQMELTIK